MVAVVPHCAAIGSSGGQNPRLAVNVGFGVWVIVPVLREMGKRYTRALRKCRVLLGLWVGPLVVLTSGVDARGACE